MQEDDPHFHDPLYRIENILPKNFRNATSYIVLPSIGTVAPIEDIKDKSIIASFMMGKME